jgi:hypothetical protein
MSAVACANCDPEDPAPGVAIEIDQRHRDPCLFRNFPSRKYQESTVRALIATTSSCHCYTCVLRKSSSLTESELCSSTVLVKTDSRTCGGYSHPNRKSPSSRQYGTPRTSAGAYTPKIIHGNDTVVNIVVNNSMARLGLFDAAVRRVAGTARRLHGPFAMTRPFRRRNPTGSSKTQNGRALILDKPSCNCP